jgi:hypothetical protein
MFPKPAGESTQAERAAPAQRRLERDGAAERVAGCVRAAQPDAVEELGDRARERLDRRPARQRRRLPEAGQVDGHDLALAAHAVEHGPPHLPLRADPVDQDQRRAAAAPDVGEGHLRKRKLRG